MTMTMSMSMPMPMTNPDRSNPMPSPVPEGRKHEGKYISPKPPSKKACIAMKRIVSIRRSVRLKPPVNLFLGPYCRFDCLFPRLTSRLPCCCGNSPSKPECFNMTVGCRQRMQHICRCRQSRQGGCSTASSERPSDSRRVLERVLARVHDGYL